MSSSSEEGRQAGSSTIGEERVVIEQLLLKIDEVFIYRIPPMRSADGHRAEDWNLAKPLNTCSLVVAQKDNDLCVNIMAERPKQNAPEGAIESFLFAQSNIHVDFNNPSHKLGHWVNPVVDSSRYFAIRIEDPITKREAFVGVGFRERTDATNFRMSMEDYINSLKREAKAVELQKKFEESLTVSKGEDGSEEKERRLPLPKSNLSLKEGEKIHININSKREKSNKQPAKVKGTVVGNTLIGLKKPPPPPNDKKVAHSSVEEPESTVANSLSDEDEWGDFEG